MEKAAEAFCVMAKEGRAAVAAAVLTTAGLRVEGRARTLGAARAMARRDIILLEGFGGEEKKNKGEVVGGKGKKSRGGMGWENLGLHG